MNQLPPFLLVLFFCSTLSFAEAQELPQDLVKSMPAVSAWKPGDDAGPLQKLETFAFALAPNAAERAPLETALCKALDDAKTREAKTFLSKMLRVVGTERCIPHAEKWLTDADGSHGARLILGHMDSPKAGAAMHRALSKSTGSVQIGIINSLGQIAYKPALNELIALMDQQDVGPAATRAVGQIGGGEALAALEQRSSKIDPNDLDAKRAHEHAILRACESANTNQSRPVYQRLFESDDQRMQLAGLRGLVRVSPADAPERLSAAMKGDNPMLSATAVALLAESGDQDTTKRFAEMLKDLPNDTQVPVLRALAERGDSAAADAVMERLKNGDDAVRAAALDVIASLGTGKHVPDLLQIAANGPGEREARSSLAQLRADDVDAALADAAKTGEPNLRVAAIRAGASRGADIADDLLGILDSKIDERIRKEAVVALAKTVQFGHVPAMLDQAAQPANRSLISGFELALKALQRNGDAAAQAKLATQIVGSVKQTEDHDARAALVRLLEVPGTDDALAVVTRHIADKHQPLQDAAIRTLADWPTAQAAPALFELAKDNTNEVYQALALRAIVRLAEQSDKAEVMYIDAMSLADTAAEQKTVLGGLAAADSPEALKLVAGYLDNPKVRDEAALAAVEIAGRIGAADQGLVRSVVASIQSKVENKNIRQVAQNVVNELDKFDGYLLGGMWQTSPTYDLKGKDSREVWGQAFAPETAFDQVKWTLLKKGFDKTSCNLGPVLGDAANTAAYFRTGIWSDKAQAARLEIGSDDACRAWLNDQQVHAWYGHRGTTPGQDIVAVQLNKGWNRVLLKVVNHSGGWGFAMRVRKADGSRLDGVKFDASK